MIQKLKEQMIKFFDSLNNKESASVSMPTTPEQTVIETPKTDLFAEYSPMATQASGLKASAQVEAAEESIEPVVLPASVIEASESPIPMYAGQFDSRFNGWIRSVALAVILVFVPNQVSWAFNYNPAVIYGPKAPIIETSLMVLPAERAAMLVSGSVGHLLSEVENKPASRIDLKVDDGVTKGSWFKPAKEFTLKINSNVQFTKTEVNEIRRWLGDPSIHHLNCGVYALNDILEARGIKKTPEEVSVMTVTLDLMSGIVKPGDKRLKTSLYALTEVAKTFDLDYSAAKFKPESVLKVRPPFIAHLTDEHFVTVTAVEGDVIRIMDLGQPAVMSRADFTAQATGFVLAEELDFFFQADFDNVPGNMQAFVWGDKWRDKGRDLPGLMSRSESWTMVAIGTGTALVGAVISGITAGIGTGVVTTLQAILSVVASIAIPEIAGAISKSFYTSCMKKGGSAASCGDKAVILNMALSTALSFGVSAGAGGGKVDWGNVAKEFVFEFRPSLYTSCTERFLLSI